MKFTLLTHEREWQKPTNSGRLVAEALPADVERFNWTRKEPDPRLLDRLSAEPSLLLYPTDDSQPLPSMDISLDTQFVLIDATWQQARKIFNHSPYLQSLTRVAVSAVRTPVYTLRRNQIPGGLCTAECVMAILDSLGEHRLADSIEAKLQAMVSRHQ